MNRHTRLNVQDSEGREEKNVKDGMDHKKEMLKTNRFKFFA